MDFDQPISGCKTEVRDRQPVDAEWQVMAYEFATDTGDTGALDMICVRDHRDVSRNGSARRILHLNPKLPPLALCDPSSRRRKKQSCGVGEPAHGCQLRNEDAAATLDSCSTPSTPALHKQKGTATDDRLPWTQTLLQAVSVDDGSAGDVDLSIDHGWDGEHISRAIVRREQQLADVARVVRM